MKKTLLAVAALLAAAAMMLPAAGSAVYAQSSSVHVVAFGVGNHFGGQGVNYGKPRI